MQLDPAIFGKQFDEAMRKVTASMADEAKTCSTLLALTPEEMRAHVAQRRALALDLVTQFRTASAELAECAQLLANAAARVEWAFNNPPDGAPTWGKATGTKQ